MKKVSIVIPMFNAEKYIRECIESCVNQDYADVEIIVVDDGSTDDSGDIVARYSGRVKYFRQKNMGGANARNVGLDLAEGEYVYFLDADDVMKKGALAKLVGALEGAGADLCVGNSERVYEDGSLAGMNLAFSEKSILNDDLERLSTIKPNPSDKLYVKSIIDNYGLKFADVRVAQDLDFYLKYLLCVDVAIVIPDMIYQYRDTPGSITHTYTDRILDIIKVFDDVRKFSKAHGKEDFYKEHLGNVELRHISGQMRKVWHISPKAERVRIMKELMLRYEQVTPNKESATYAETFKMIREGNRYVRHWRAYTSEPFCRLVRMLKGER